MIILGIDFGQKNIGLAISDETELVAVRLPPIKVRDNKNALEKIRQIAEKNKIEKILLGIPFGWEGKDSPQTKSVKNFYKLLKKDLKIQIELWDESYSSKQAGIKARGKKKEQSHSEAARIILQEYLDR